MPNEFRRTGPRFRKNLQLIRQSLFGFGAAEGSAQPRVRRSRGFGAAANGAGAPFGGSRCGAGRTDLDRNRRPNATLSGEAGAGCSRSS